MTDMFDATGVRAALRSHRPFDVDVPCRPCGEPFYVGKEGMRAGALRCL